MKEWVAGKGKYSWWNPDVQVQHIGPCSDERHAEEEEGEKWDTGHVVGDGCGRKQGEFFYRETPQDR